MHRLKLSHRVRVWQPAAMIAAVLGLALGWTGPAAAQVETSPRAERLFAWGGYGALAPENTEAAILAALDAGFPRLWLDLRASADGELVLMRDGTLDRTTDCSGRVDAYTRTELQSCDAGSWFDPSFAGQRVPTLAQALAIAGEAELVLELHSGDPIGLVGDLQDAGIGRVTVISRDRDVLGVLATISSIQFKTRLWVDFMDARDIPGLTASGIWGLSVAPENLDEGVAAELLAAGLELSVGPADEEGAMYAGLAAGASQLAVARLEPLAFAAGLAFRTYTAPAFGLALSEDQQLGGGLMVGDFNADQRADLVIGAPRDDAAVPGGGWLAVLPGGQRFPGQPIPDSGDEAQGEWGSVFTVADFGADGFDDLALGVPQRDFNGGNSGSIWLWDGGPGGIGGFKRPIGPQPQPGSRLGSALAAGDFNGDAIPDLAVSAPQQSVLGQTAAGRVLVLPGQAGSGAVSTGALQIDRESEETPGTVLARERLGASLAMGDFNADGFDDLAMGAPGARPGDQADAGSLLLAFGGPNDPETGDLTPLRLVEISRETEDVPDLAERDGAFGSALAVADFDGDGIADLAVGEPGATAGSQRLAGAVTVLYGREDEGEEEAGAFALERSLVFDVTDGVVPGEPAGRAAFGASLAAADLDGDGRSDLFIGSEEPTGRIQSSGGIYVVRGGATGLDTRWSFRLAPGMRGLAIPPAANQRFAQRMAVADLNGDDKLDIAIGVPGQPVDGLDRAGTLLVAFGYDPVLPGVPTPTDLPATATVSPTPTFPVSPSITPTASITPTPSNTPPASATPRPPDPIFLPITLRLRSFFGRYPTPAAGIAIPR